MESLIQEKFSSAQIVVDKVELNQNQNNFQIMQDNDENDGGTYTKAVVRGGKIKILEVSSEYYLDTEIFNEWLMEMLQDDLLDEVRPIVPTLNTVSVESGIAPTSSPTVSPSMQVSEKQVVEIQKQNKQDVEITSPSPEPDKVGAGTVVAYVFGILGFILVFFFLAREKKKREKQEKEGRHTQLDEENQLSYTPDTSRDEEYTIEVCTDQGNITQ